MSTTVSKKELLDLVKRAIKRRSKEELQDPNLADSIVQEVQAETSADPGDDDKDKPVKKRFVVVVYDPEGELKGKELTGSVIQIPEDESVYTAVERLHRAGYAFNATKKGRRFPVKTVGEICEHVPARIAKEEKVWIKHKEPVFLMPTDGILPTDSTGKHIDKRKKQDA